MASILEGEVDVRSLLECRCSTSNRAALQTVLPSLVETMRCRNMTYVNLCQQECIKFELNLRLNTAVNHHLKLQWAPVDDLLAGGRIKFCLGLRE